MAVPTSPPSLPKQAKAPVQAQPIDWQQRLGMAGFTPQMIARIEQIWRSSNYSAQTAAPLVLGYVRSTPWYQQTYPGIAAGIQAGLFSDERGYSAYRNQINQQYRQFYGRPATNAEVGQFVAAGTTPQQVGAQLESHAVLGTLQDPLKHLFTPQELKALSDQAAGIHTDLGAQVQQQASLATQLNPIYQQYTSAPVSRAQVISAFHSGVDPATVAKQFQGSAILTAQLPQIKQAVGSFGDTGGQFTAPELRALGNQFGGLDSVAGQRMLDIYTRAQRRMDQSFRNVLGRVAVGPTQTRRSDVGA